MKRSEINSIYQEARTVFKKNGWALPPNAQWDITDFGLGDFDNFGLTLINLADEAEYCEKLMYAREGQRTPAHTHHKKKEDIICRSGEMKLLLWDRHPDKASEASELAVQINGESQRHENGAILILKAGDRITLTPGIYHEFWPSLPNTVIGEVSTANDDVNDNIFVNVDIGRFPGIEEDEPALVRLLSEK